MPYSRFRFLGEGIYLTCLTSYGYSSRLWCDIFIVRSAMQWRKGNSSNTVGSFFTLLSSVLEPACTVTGWLMCNLSSFMFRHNSLRLKSSHAGNFTPWNWVNDTNQAPFFRELVVRHVIAHHCLHFFPSSYLVLAVVLLTT